MSRFPLSLSLEFIETLVKVSTQKTKIQSDAGSRPARSLLAVLGVSINKMP